MKGGWMDGLPNGYTAAINIAKYLGNAYPALVDIGLLPGPLLLTCRTQDESTIKTRIIHHIEPPGGPPNEEAFFNFLGQAQKTTV